MLTSNQLKQIKQILKLDSISVIEKVIVVCFPKKEIDMKKFKDVQKQLKTISPIIELTIGENGETVGSLIEYKEENK